MKGLVAKRAILYQGRQYEPGEPLPACDPVMVDAWLRGNSAEIINNSITDSGEDNQVDPEAGNGMQDTPGNQENEQIDPKVGNDVQEDSSNDPEKEQVDQDPTNGPDFASGHLDPADLMNMSKEDLKKLAKDMGVSLPRNETPAQIAEKLTSVAVYAPINDGSAQ